MTEFQNPQVVELAEANQRLRDGYADAAAGLEYVRTNHGKLYGVGFDRVADHFFEWVTMPEREGLQAGSHKLPSARITGDKDRENPVEGAPYGEGLIGRIDALEVKNAELRRAWAYAQDRQISLMQQRTTLEARIAEQDRLLKLAREALREIADLPGEINPSNYDHDDACELNRQFCYGGTIAAQALAAMEQADAD